VLTTGTFVTMLFQRKNLCEYSISVRSNVLASASSQHAIVLVGIIRVTIHLPNISLGIVCDCAGFVLSSQREAAIKAVAGFHFGRNAPITKYEAPHYCDASRAFDETVGLIPEPTISYEVRLRNVGWIAAVGVPGN
jgi:hypothetical protein